VILYLKYNESRGYPLGRSRLPSAVSRQSSVVTPFMKDWSEIKSWRKARRAELIAAREACTPEQRKVWNEKITASLEQGFPIPAGAVVGFCWPHRGEFDARFAVRHWRERGATAALPAVVEKAGPLEFRHWWPGAPMKPEVYNIPVPDGTAVLPPDFAIVPMNGFDSRGFRLGYGGGYFDRTLAALDRRVIAIGVSYEAMRLPTIHAQAHDIPMDFIVTEAGIYRGGGEDLRRLNLTESAAEAEALMRSRKLPRHRVAASPVTTAGGNASPVCYAQDVAPDYFGAEGPMSDRELVELLNVLLEAERAGAKVLAAFLDEHVKDSPAWKQIVAVQRDEARNCAVLIDLVDRLKGKPSAKTGDFLGKALAIQGKVARLEFLNRGQAWVARKIAEALPRIGQEFVRGPLQAMHESHLLNIEACESLIETLEG
jgi:5-formyltetrahydrofolate cyclo-ligase